MLLVLLPAALGVGSPAWGAPIPLPALDQIEVNQAINKGVQYLKARQTPRGTWATGNSHAVGYAALPALTLLECGIPANDRQIQAAAQFVRTSCASGKVSGTYEIALSILFLDRLRDPRDRNMIHALTARLIAGQTSSGGWSYKCPELTATQTRDILSLLYQLNPPKSPVDTASPKDPSGVIDSPGSKDPTLPATTDPTKPKTETPIESGYGPTRMFPRSGYCIKMDDWSQTDSKTAQANPPVQNPAKPPPNVKIPPHLAMLPVFQDPNLPPRPDPQGNHATPGVTDNSNTQFAILALWVAQRHGVPMERSLGLVVKRFRTSQNNDGRWGYRYAFGGGAGGSHAMNCVGLLGLAIGHGIAQNPDAKERAATDEMLKKGFLALYRTIAQPQGRMKDLPMENLYFMWSVERVAVLYDLPTILDKDWYRWGAEILVANQFADGSWASTNYPGHSPQIDTCLALLFLKRANLARDLTNKLPYNPSQLNQELIARLPKEPAPPAAVPAERPEEESVKDPNAQASPPPPATTPEAPPQVERPVAPASTSSESEEEPASGGSKKFLFFAIGLVVLIVLFGSIALFVMSRSSDEDDEEKGKGARRPHRRSETRKVKKAARH